MEEAEQARAAARDAVRDVEPSDLRRAMDDRLAQCSVVPGALVFLAADATPGRADDGLAERAAGVQLVYEGLVLTRDLVETVPWTSADADADTPADLDVLAADVLVAKGFRLLARTEAADAAVRTVREFGRERTDAQAGRESTTRSLEASVFDLAAVAGASAVGTDVPRGLRQYAVGLADSWGERPLGSPAEVLPERPADVMARVAGPSAPDGDDAVRPSATDH
ncbi:hypothetical protein J2752_001046 [Halarchaeum rubridurum]|uniref:Uncharacterized protein n=1 Tax=Halarchaeum rubridurum TaxID=489911 RepID=A0A830FX81_9EURY|nr:hypothetical protein [Halarchaeum rubridurum]MBP1954165.1 hypothetical protein [Halarchaeum rubridurum]GGM57849.1 hypothetical protein GCM10009017_05010 [Halarchaeum rubridurum]